jgi:toxin CcdB
MRPSMTIRQFDVLENPIPRARRALPFVAILQSDLVQTGRERVVAPLAPSATMPTLAGRLIPIVKVENRDYALLVPSLATLPVADLRRVVANLADDRERILAALDYLFIGY